MDAKTADGNLQFLFQAVLELRTMEECEKFFTDLCTVPELRAMSQRLVVAKLLDDHKVYNEIVSLTGASTATISRVNRSLHYGNNGYRPVLDRIEEKEK